jgi:hypothetical protein
MRVESYPDKVAGTLRVPDKVAGTLRVPDKVAGTLRVPDKVAGTLRVPFATLVAQGLCLLLCTSTFYGLGIKT